VKTVLLESPYAGDVPRNEAYARRAMTYLLGSGYAPFAGHLLYTQVLDDTVPEQRNRGIDAHLAWMDRVDEVWFFLDHGWSRGMRQALAVAHSKSKRVVGCCLDDMTRESLSAVRQLGGESVVHRKGLEDPVSSFHSWDPEPGQVWQNRKKPDKAFDAAVLTIGSDTRNGEYVVAQVAGRTEPLVLTIPMFVQRYRRAQ